MQQQLKSFLSVPYRVAVLMTDADEAMARNDRETAEALIAQIYGSLDEAED